MKKKIRIAVIGTGNVASIAIRCIKGREDMELVGVWAHKETAGHLIGTDSGLLDSEEKNGVLITGEEQDIYDAKPDCVFMAINIRDPFAAAKVNGVWYKKFLSRGINVVSPSVPDLMWPKAAFNKELVSEIEAAAKQGGASIYINGQEPGYAEHQAMMLATCANTIKTLTVTEMYNYSSSPVREELTFGYGFDELPEFQAALESPEAQIGIWSIPIINIANKLGYELENITASFEKRVTDHDIPVGYGVIKAGKVAAVRLRTCGIINGREAIVLEHVNRMAQDIAPDWPYTERVGQIRVTIEGDPNLQLDMNVGTADHPEELSYDGYVLTAMRVLNAAPYVVNAEPGIITVHDLPLTTPSSAFRSDAVYVPHKVCRTK